MMFTYGQYQLCIPTWRARLVGLQQRLSWAQRLLEAHPNDKASQGVVLAAEESLTLFEKSRADWVDQTLQARWLLDGDRCTKLFFKNFKSLATSKQIPSLIDGQGSQLPHGKKWLRKSSNILRRVLANTLLPHPPRKAVNQWHEILDPIPDRLMQEEKQQLNADLTLHELGEAARSMKKLKMPDGLPVEFFNYAWPLVGPWWAQFFSRC